MKLGNRAQGSVENLLLIGAAVALATIVGLTLKAIINAQSPEVQQRTGETIDQIENP